MKENKFTKLDYMRFLVMVHKKTNIVFYNACKINHNDDSDYDHIYASDKDKDISTYKKIKRSTNDDNIINIKFRHSLKDSNKHVIYNTTRETEITKMLTSEDNEIRNLMFGILLEKYKQDE